ncbi:hypothetical protein T07_1136 [Trichinella nelsoni]|uniref:Uncharacterized protein n=1 Tax=Trichinella nelsoni TaxID=6336 RepID=A0A0V0RV41_9BILA|nr:hypothetical protein T07_1136 [Trichinella nelsoni]
MHDCFEKASSRAALCNTGAAIFIKLLKIEEQFQFLITRPTRLIGIILFAENEMPVIWNLKIVQ